MHAHAGHAVFEHPLFHFGCPCGATLTFHVDDLQVHRFADDGNSHHATLPPCPACNRLTSLNCQIPDDHPHQSAPHIRALVAHLKQHNEKVWE